MYTCNAFTFFTQYHDPVEGRWRTNRLTVMMSLIAMEVKTLVSIPKSFKYVIVF